MALEVGVVEVNEGVLEAQTNMRPYKKISYSKFHMQNGLKVDICLGIYYLLRSLRLGLSRFMRVS